MQELMKQKRFLSAFIASVLIIIVHYLFKENPEMIDGITQWIVTLFGAHIGGTTLTDMFGKGKVQADTKRLELEVKNKELTKALKKDGSSENLW